MADIRNEGLDELLADYERPEDLLGEPGLFKQLKKALLERALGAELSEHLGHEKGDPSGWGTGNSRNGRTGKTVLTEDGPIDLAAPRDRNGTFEPQIVPKGTSRLDGFDNKIIGLYAGGMTVREIQGHLRELYGIDVSPDLISRVTDAVLEEVKEWQNRPLDPIYPVVFLDALRVKIRDDGAPTALRSGPFRTRARLRRRAATRRSTSPWASPWTATRRSSAFGSNRPKAPSSG